MYSGVQMLLVSRDGNMENVKIDVALVPSEDSANYRWFISKVAEAGLNMLQYPIVCDRSTALLPVAGDMGLTLRFCTLHIIRNVLATFKSFNHQHKALVWGLQAAETVEEYNSKLA